MKIDKNYIVWTNLGYEGWNPTGFDTVEELEKYILDSSNYGTERVFTKRLDINIKLKEQKDP